MKKLLATSLLAITVANAANIIIQNDSKCKFIHSGNFATPEVRKHTAASVINPHSSGLIYVDFNGSHDYDYIADLYISSCDESGYIYLSIVADNSNWEAALDMNDKIHLTNMSYKDDDVEICGGDGFASNKVIIADKK